MMRDSILNIATQIDLEKSYLIVKEVCHDPIAPPMAPPRAIVKFLSEKKELRLFIAVRPSPILREREL